MPVNKTTEKGAAALREALPSQPPYTAGVLALPPGQFKLFYESRDVLRTACSIDLANASPEELGKLSDACEPATFGRNQEHVLDETYRKAGKMDTTSFATSIVPERTGLIDAIRTQLLDGSDSTRPITLELYKLNVYGEGSFFKAHKDTPRSETMFGSLVLVFPTPHEGGSLTLRHNDEEWTFDSADACRSQQKPSIAFVTFFSDVEHEVTPVTSGYRVTLTYNLYVGDMEIDSGDSQPGVIARTSLAPVMSSGEQLFRSTFEDLLTNPTFLPDGGALGFGLEHEYPIKDSLEHVYQLLKGSDAVILRTCDALCLSARLHLIYPENSSFGGSTMLDFVPNFGDHVFYVEGQTELLTRQYGAIVVATRSKYLKVEDEVTWVIPKTQTKLNSKYVAHGNEPQMSCAYGKVFLIVRVGKFGERSVVVDPLKERRRVRREEKEKALAQAKLREQEWAQKRRRVSEETKASEEKNMEDVAKDAGGAKA